MSYTPIDSEVRDYVQRQVAAGFDSPGTLAERGAEIYGADPEVVETLVAAALNARANECLTWPAVTDCDRLDRAFAALDASGILARQHFTCCNTCGHSEMFDLVNDERERGRGIDGYVFFHRQDTDKVVAYGVLRVSYAAMGSSQAATVAIGRRIVESLRAQGLTVTWDEDPEKKIELPSFDWKRRAPPITLSPTWTAESVVDRWCHDLPRTAAAELANALGETYVEAAVAAGCIDVGFAWARAPLAATRIGQTRSQTLMRLALALRVTDVPSARIADLWLEAYSVAPYGRNGALIDLLVAGDLRTPAVLAAARDRVLQSRRDMYGAAAIAWYLVRAPTGSNDQNERATMLAQIQRTFDAPNELYIDEPIARAALAAALWVIQLRQGDMDPARSARDFAFQTISSPVITAISPRAQRAALAAAAEVGEFGAIANLMPNLAVQAPALCAEFVDALVRAGQIDAAAAFAEHANQATRLFARLARRAPDDPRAANWIERASAAEVELPALYEEGLLSADEARDARLELVALRGDRGERDRARTELGAVAAAIRSDVAAAGARMLAHLQQVRAGERGPALPGDARWFGPDGARALERALAKWEAATDRIQRIRVRRQAALILEAAAALANRGELTRARGLVDRVLGHRDDETELPKFVDGPLVAAWIALDKLDRALAHAHEAGSLAPDAIAPIAVRLAELGRLPEALEFVGTALDRANERADLLALAPAVLAISSDRRACAAAMLAAWHRGETALDTLCC